LAGAAVALLVLVPAGAQAQDAPPSQQLQGPIRLTGIVLDRQEEAPIEGATVRIVPADAEDEPIWEGVSNEAGRFRAADIPAGRYRINFEAFLYAALSSDVVITEGATIDMRAQMVPVDFFELEPVVATVRRRNLLETQGFYARRRMGSGDFMTRDEIEARNPYQITDLFRTIPGTQVASGGVGIGATVRLRGGCVPRVVMDGVVLANPVTIDDLLATRDVEALEVHHTSSLPIQYAALTSCGVVMLWTRDPTAATDANPLSLRRIVVALGLGAVMVILGTR